MTGTEFTSLFHILSLPRVEVAACSSRPYYPLLLLLALARLTYCTLHSAPSSDARTTMKVGERKKGIPDQICGKRNRVVNV